MAVSGVIDALPFAISLMVFSGRPIRRANSAWVIPRSSSASTRRSPGTTDQSGVHAERGSVAMVVNNLYHPHPSHETLIDEPICEQGERLMVGFEQEPVGSIESDGVGSSSIFGEPMAVSRDAGHVLERR